MINTCKMHKSRTSQAMNVNTGLNVKHHQAMKTSTMTTMRSEETRFLLKQKFKQAA